MLLVLLGTRGGCEEGLSVPIGASVGPCVREGGWWKCWRGWRRGEIERGGVGSRSFRGACRSRVGNDGQALTSCPA
eukprot:28442-Pyramimonas_sp.AAC.1